MADKYLTQGLGVKPIIPNYGENPDDQEPIYVGQNFNEFAAGPSQPSSITQPAAPGPSVIPQVGGPGTITYGETVVKPEKVTQQPLPWWYQDYLNKEQATVDREKAAQREADARYWAEQEFKKRVGNLVPRSMAEAVAASKEKSKIEGQLGMQYDIKAGVPVEQALAKWGGMIWSDKMPLAGGQARRTVPTGPPEVHVVHGKPFIRSGQGWLPVNSPEDIPKPTLESFRDPVTGETVSAFVQGGIVKPRAKQTPPRKSITVELDTGEKLQLDEEKAEPYFQDLVNSYEELVKSSSGTKKTKAQQALQSYKRALEAVKSKKAQSNTVNIQTGQSVAPSNADMLRNLPRINTQSEYDALASGDVYISKDGSLRKKP